MKVLPPFGILLERMMTMSYFTSQKKTKCQYLKCRLYQNWLRIACPTFFQRAPVPLSQWFRQEISFVLQKYVKTCSCLFTVTKGIAFLCIWRNTQTDFFLKKGFIQPILYDAHYDLDIHQYSLTKCYWNIFPDHICLY